MTLTLAKTPWLDRTCACGLPNHTHSDDDYDAHGECRRATGLSARVERLETTLAQTQAVLSRREADVERLTQEVRAERETTAMLEGERDGLLDDVSLFVSERDAAWRANAALRAEFDALRDLAETAMRAASTEARLMAASVVCARLVRPSAPTCRDESCPNAVSEEGLLCKPCRDEVGGYEREVERE